MSEKSEHMILFSAPMVRAILDGSKTQTRRAVRKQFPQNAEPAEVPATSPEGWQISGHSGLWWDDCAGCIDDAIRCPYGISGDRLAVKETFYAWGRWETRFNAKKGRDEWHFVDMTLESGKQYRYAASMTGDNGPRIRGSVTPQWWKRPAIFMPRHASRILLDVVAVRIEQLQSIGPEDCLAEGIASRSGGRCDLTGEYQQLWQSINGPSSWEANPWVWVVGFKRVQA